MAELTRDDVLDIMLECDPHVCCKCALEPQKHWCYEIKESALNSLRDDYTEAIEINSFLVSQFDTDEIETILREKLHELPKTELDAAAEKYYREVL